MATKVKKLPAATKAIHNAAIDMSKKEAQYLLEEFYKLKTVQQSAKSHLRCLNQLQLQNDALKFFTNNICNIRYQATTILGIWAEQFPEAKWARMINGIGAVISAGLVIYIDIDKAKSYSSLRKWAGQMPDSRVLTLHNADKLALESIDLFGEDITDEHIHWLAKKAGKDFDIFKVFCRTKNKPSQWTKVIGAMRAADYCTGLRRV